MSFGPPVRVGPLYDPGSSWLRAPPFVSADSDAQGTIYLTWSTCEQCEEDIVLTQSRNGVTWTEAVGIPTGGTERSLDYVLPALAVDPATSGRTARVAVLYYSLRPPNVCNPVGACLSTDVALVTSGDGGTTWTPPQQLNAVSMPLTWLADTSLGPMLGTTSRSRG